MIANYFLAEGVEKGISKDYFILKTKPNSKEYKLQRMLIDFFTLLAWQPKNNAPLLEEYKVVCIFTDTLLISKFDNISITRDPLDFSNITSLSKTTSLNTNMTVSYKGILRFDLKFTDLSYSYFLLKPSILDLYVS